MLEWVCTKCNRNVDPGLTRCPFCGFEEGKPEAPTAAAPADAASPTQAGGRSVRRVIVRRKSRFDWPTIFADLERGFRFGLGFVAALAVSYFVLYLIAYYGGRGELADLLADWLRLR